MTDRSCADVTERLFHMFEAVHPLPVITAVVDSAAPTSTACPPGRFRNCWNGWPPSG